MGELYRTVYEAFSALREIVPDTHADVGLRREVQGICVLTAPFALYSASSYPFETAIQNDARIRLMRQVIGQARPFVDIFASTTKKNRARRRRRDVKATEERQYASFRAYAAEIRADGSREAQLTGRDISDMALRIAIETEETLPGQAAFHIGKIADDCLLGAYQDRGLIDDEGHLLPTRDGLLAEYFFFQQVLRRVHSEVYCR